MPDIDKRLAYRLWLYAKRSAEHATQLNPGHGRSAGPLMTVEMLSASMRASLIGLALMTDEGVGDIEKVPFSLFVVARAVEMAGARSFARTEMDALMMVDRIVSAGLDRHLVPQEMCELVERHASSLAWTLAADLQNRLPQGGDTE